MARGINKVILVGNVGNDPETKHTAGGMAVTTLSLATTSVRKDRDGNTQERTEWHRVKFFGKLAEIVGEYVTKGRQLYIEGSIRYDKYTDKDGVERYTSDIIGDEMQMLGSDPNRESGGQRPQQSSRPARQQTPQQSARPARPARQPAQQERAPAANFADDFADDDIPF